MYSSVLKQTLNKLKINSINGVRRHGMRSYASTATSTDADEYTAEPEYPEIQDLSWPARRSRKALALHEELKNVTTIEGKLIKINMPRYYGFKCHMLNEEFGYQYNCLPYYKQWTRTDFKGDIPADYFDANADEENKLISEVRHLIEETIVLQNRGIRSKKIEDALERERTSTLNICAEINRILLAALRPTASHLNEVELDVEPRHEAFWYAGGIDPLASVQKARKNTPAWKKHDYMEPVDRPFQFQGTPLLALRHSAPLQPLHDFDHAEVATTDKVPHSRLDPRAMGFATSYRHGTTIPGFWPGSIHQFGHLSFNDRTHLINRNPAYGAEDNQEALHAQGIIRSFGWLFGQACYQGFSTYNDITYPLVGQTIITNGQYWSFYLYQLNTTVMNCEVINSNPKVNECYGTNEIKLYDSIDANGQLVGFNEEVLRHLIRFYRNTPKVRDIDMQPYLDVEEKTVADIEDLKRREFLESTFKHIVANKPRHLLPPEIHDWERIYKIDNQTMPMDARRRFFELGINPWKRRMDEHAPAYIPKALRPGGPKSKEKFEKTYWP